MKKFIALAALIAVGLTGFSQDEKSKKILNEMSEKAKTYKTVKASFSKTFKKGKLNETSNGEVMIKGDKYFLKSGEGQNIYSNGRTVWTHIPDTKEVYKCPASEMDDMLSPSKMFTVWEDDFKYRYVNEESMNGKTYHVIKLHPQNAGDKNFHTITIKIEKENNELEYFIIKGKDGSITTYQLKDFKANESIPDDTFNFNPNKFPGVDVMDC